MSWRSRVVWSQGMFLQPHHFQQEARYLERLVDARSACMASDAYGFAHLQIDEGLLALGKLGLARAQGVFADGTPFHMPQLDAMPHPLEVPADMKGELVVLALPLQQEGSDECSFEEGSAAAMSRYQAAQEQVRDSTLASDEPATIQTGQLRARLMRAKEVSGAFTVLGAAWVQERRPDNAVVLERSYIPPQVHLNASPHLAASAHLLHGLVQQRAQALAGRMGQLGHGVSELADFLMLQTLNRYEPQLAQHTASPVAHPRQWHRDCLQLAGDLATLATPERRPPHFPTYKHDDLKASFTPLLDALREMLSIAIQTNTVAIELVARPHGVHTAVIADLELARSATFVLAVNANVPAEQLRQHFPAQSKIGPVEKIRDLVNLQLPGIGLKALPVAPRQLPFHAGYYYFELERNSPLWQPLQANGNMAMHIAGEFPGLELQLWAIRR